MNQSKTLKASFARILLCLKLKCALLNSVQPIKQRFYFTYVKGILKFFKIPHISKKKQSATIFDFFTTAR